jgi:hypothetical protein
MQMKNPAEHLLRRLIFVRALLRCCLLPARPSVKEKSLAAADLSAHPSSFLDLHKSD